MESITWDLELCSFVPVPLVCRCSDPLRMMLFNSSSVEIDTTVTLSIDTMPCTFQHSNNSQFEDKFVKVKHANLHSIKVTISN